MRTYSLEVILDLDLTDHGSSPAWQFLRFLLLFSFSLFVVIFPV